MTTIEKPNNLEESHLIYLDDLRESGVTNMYGAGAFLERAFGELNRREARDILQYWMKTFSERHANG